MKKTTKNSKEFEKRRTAEFDFDALIKKDIDSADVSINRNRIKVTIQYKDGRYETKEYDRK